AQVDRGRALRGGNGAAGIGSREGDGPPRRRHRLPAALHRHARAGGGHAHRAQPHRRAARSADPLRLSCATVGGRPAAHAGDPRKPLAPALDRPRKSLIIKETEETMGRGRCGLTMGAAAMILALALALGLTAVASAQVIAPRVENVQIPSNVDPFSLSFEDFKNYSAAKNFELIGQSYFKIPERTPWAKGQGRPGTELGSGFNGVRVYDGIAYLGGFNSPPTLFGIVIADVRDPRNIKPLSFIPCNPGTRCNYLRVNREKKILI